MELIDKAAVVAEIERRRDAALMRQRNLEAIGQETVLNEMIAFNLNRVISFLNTLEVKDPYEQSVQYDSIKAGIQAHAETYSFNIESELFNQLTKEQQALWRKEIEQAYISGGNAGVGLARDIRYKENVGVKKVDLEKEKVENIKKQCPFREVVCSKYQDHPLRCSGACAFVSDRITLEKKHLHDIQNVPVDEEKLRNDRRNII